MNRVTFRKAKRAGSPRSLIVRVNGEDVGWLEPFNSPSDTWYFYVGSEKQGIARVNTASNPQLFEAAREQCRAFIVRQLEAAR